MLGVERVAVGSAVALPEMVVVNLGGGKTVCGGFGRKDLAIDGSVFISYCGYFFVGRKLGGSTRAVVALDEECRLQCRLSVEARTNAYQIRMGEYPEEQISVYVTARQYGSLSPATTFVQTLDRLSQVCQEMLENHVIEQILQPLQRTIAMK